MDPECPKRGVRPEASLAQVRDPECPRPTEPVGLLAHTRGEESDDDFYDTGVV